MHVLVIDDSAIANLLTNILTAVMFLGIVVLVGMLAWALFKCFAALGKRALQKTRDLLG